MNYQFQNRFGRISGITRNSDNAFIPLTVENRDCAQFLEEWKAGATVVNADSSPAPYSDAAARALGLEP